MRSANTLVFVHDIVRQLSASHAPSRRTPPWVALLSILAVFCAEVCAYAAVVYFDDFQQFAPGTSLTTLTYTPASGPPTASATTRVLNGSPTITASVLNGSTCAFFDNSVVINKSDYLASLAGSLNNEVLEITWNMSIKSTNSGPGVFMISVPTTDSTASYNPPLAFMDTGSIVVFTNAPSPQAASLAGSWANLADTFMTNRLILNYPERKLWFSLNGQPLVSSPLGLYFSNVVDRLGFTAFERSQGSIGNQFALDNVRVETRSLAPTITSVQVSGATMTIAFTTLPSSLYAVETCTNLLPTSWASLTNNVPGTADITQVADSSPALETVRFYRVLKSQ